MRCGEAFEVVEDEGLFVGNNGGRAVTTVIKKRSTRGNGLFDGCGGSRIGQTGGSRYACVVIPVDFVDGEAFFPVLCDGGGNAFGIFGVLVGVSVIGHHHNFVFPWAGIFIFEVALYFVNENFCFLFGGTNHSSGGKIHFFGINVFPFAVIEQGVEIICHKTADRTDTLCGCVVFVGEKIVIGGLILPFFCNESIVPGTFAHQ